MIAVGEQGGAIVLVFDRASKQQTLTDAEARSLHAQLALLINTRAQPPASVPLTAASHHAPAVNGSKPAFQPLVRRKPVLGEGKGTTAAQVLSSATVVDDGDDTDDDVDPLAAARKLDEDELARRKAATG